MGGRNNKYRCRPDFDDQSSFQVIICGAAPTFRITICTTRVVSPDFPTLTMRKIGSRNPTSWLSALNCSGEKPSAARTSSKDLNFASSSVPSIPSGPRRYCKKASTRGSVVPGSASRTSRDAQVRSTGPLLLRVKSLSQPGAAVTIEQTIDHPVSFIKINAFVLEILP